MSEPKELAPERIAQEFLDALVANDSATYERILTEDAGLRIGRWDGAEAYRPRKRVIARLIEEWSAWPDPTLQTLSMLAQGQRAVVEFRIKATESGRYVEHNRAAFLALQEDKIQIIDLYCPEPLLTGRPKDWIAPATLSDEELVRLFESARASFDIREWFPPSMNGRISMRGVSWDSGGTHPGSSGVGGVHWTAEEADRKIEEMIAYHRERNSGFQWFVGPFDTPPDLRERLERHGFVLAGDAAVMARRGLDNLDDIPENPEVRVERLDGTDMDAFDAAIQIMERCFHMTPEQIEDRRPGWLERVQNPEIRKEEFSYLARMDGVPVGYGRVILRGGSAYLGGAATLPEHRGRRVYSTLLKQRLEEARAHGYQIAHIDAQPMSRRIVQRYDFREYARNYLYVWMPVIDMEVVRSLVPDE